MKTPERLKNNRYQTLLVALVIVGLLVTVIPVTYVYAASGDKATNTPVPNDKDAGGFVVSILERIFAFQNKMLNYLDKRLSRTDEMQSRAQNKITSLKQQGNNVAALETALDEFYRRISEANQAKVKAKSILDLHSGFDGDGKVVNKALARETIRNVEAVIKDCRENIIQALRVISGGLNRYYKDQNQPIGDVSGDE